MAKDGEPKDVQHTHRDGAVRRARRRLEDTEQVVPVGRPSTTRHMKRAALGSSSGIPGEKMKLMHTTLRSSWCRKGRYISESSARVFEELSPPHRLSASLVLELARELPSLSFSCPTGPESSKGALTARGTTPCAGRRETLTAKMARPPRARAS